jgi:prevent-host-death family protein
MKSVNIHEAKTHLSRLLEEAAKGRPFVIAKSGKAVAKVVPIESDAEFAKRRLGFLAGAISVPDDFDDMGDSEIASLFGHTP